MDAQMKKGVLEMCILHCISEEKRYGYDIIQNMCEYFPEVSESTFYAILRRLNSEGATAVFYGEKSNGPARKYYKMTPLGSERLAGSIADWHHISETVTKLGIA
ncbi:MAG: PadR family transcriptional regulator [Oscillospiraceae bacterium]